MCFWVTSLKEKFLRICVDMKPELCIFERYFDTFNERFFTSPHSKLGSAFIK